ncbi:MAG: ATP-binding protein, partial [Eubacterium sp.]|nr:ATP-binding protein [Eubacterium sp.]
YYIAVAIGITYFFSKKNIFRFSFRYLSSKICALIIKNGIPTVINQVSLVLLVYVFNQILLNVGGDLAVASYSVITTISNICYSFGGGIAAVSLTLSSLLYGDEDRSSLYLLVRIMTRYAVVINAIVTVAVAILSPLLVNMFLDDNAAYDMATLGLRLFVLSLIPCSLNTCFKNFYQGTSRIGFTQLISVLQNFALTALSGFILSRFFGTSGVWLGFVCGESLTFLIITFIVWNRDHSLKPLTEVFAFLKKDIGVPDDECFEMTVYDSEGAIEASKAAQKFCLERGESDKTSMCVAVCIEEICLNAIKYGFEADKKDHLIEIRYMDKDGVKTLRIRDDCSYFDPVTYLKESDGEAPEKHIGIRMMMAMVKDARYISSLGFNNLTLVF